MRSGFLATKPCSLLVGRRRPQSGRTATRSKIRPRRAGCQPARRIPSAPTAWILACCCAFAVPGFASTGVTRFGDFPFRFESNQGQAEPAVRFLARGPGYSLGLTAQGSALSLLDTAHGVSAVVNTRFVGGNPDSRIEPFDPQSAETNYILGNDPAKWLRNVPSWGRVKYAQVYPGIDLVFYGASHRLEYDFNVSPGADPASIQLEFSGARNIRLDSSGDLLLETAAGDIRWEKPVMYQQYGTKRRPVAGAFALEDHGRVAFHVGAYDHSRELVIDPALAYATYLGGSKNDAAVSVAVDSAGAVYICGYTGSDDMPKTGGGFQSGFAGGVVQSAISGDAFVAKIDPVSGQVIYNTYLGGRGDDFAQGIAVDATGAVYVAGYTTSANFPVTQNAFSGKYGGAGGNNYKITGDAFLTKLNPAGNGLVYSTYFGGSQDDAALALAVDSTGAAYIAGMTLSRNLPTTAGVLQPGFRGSGGNITIEHGLEDTAQPSVVTGDAFVAKFTPGGALAFATYLGGSLDDIATAIALDASGNIYVTGATLSKDFPTTQGSLQTAYQGTDPNSQYLVVTGDAFVSKIDPTGAKLLYSTYLGGSRDEMGLGIAVDATGAAFVTGFTSSLNFPTTAGAYSRAYKGPPTLSELLNFMAGDVFVANLNPAGSQLVFSTLIGGVNDDGGTGIALDPLGNIYVSGFTNSGEFPTTADALQKTFPGVVYVEPPSLSNVFAAPHPIGHPFLVKMPPDGSSILYSTFLGGTGNDRGLARLALDSAGSAYLTGLTGSTNFPVTPNAAQPRYGGARNSNDPKGDAWMAKISGLFPPQTPPTLPPAPAPVLVTSVANAASLAAGAVAPGEIVVINGSGFGASGASVLFDGVAAPLVNATAAQLTAVAPYEIAAETSTQLTVTFNQQTSAPTTLTVAPSSPGLFSADSSGAGQALASNSDGSANSANNPANPGDTITLYGTGEGQTDPPGVDGQIANDAPPQPVLPLSVTIGGQPAQVNTYGGQPGQIAGYLQIAVQVPSGLDAGDQPVAVTVGSASSQPNLTVAISGNSPSASPASRKRRRPGRQP